MGIEFNTWFPTSPYGTETVNVGAFGPHADNTAHTMTSLGYANLAAAQVDYPSATSMNDTSDWCAITEALKLALKTETPPGSGTWVSNTTGPWNNKAVFIPPGLYVINKPIRIENIEGVTMYSTNHGANIFNENFTEPNNICFAINGMRYSYFEDIQFQARGTNAIAFDMNQYDVVPPLSVSTNSFLFVNCSFTAGGPGSVACWIGRGGLMGSEGTFICCGATGIDGYGNAAAGFLIDNPNALNYNFHHCGGTFCDEWIRVNTGGAINIFNASLAANVKDLSILAGTCTAMTVRTESKHFCTTSGNTTLISCGQAYEGSEAVFLEANGDVTLINCSTSQGRICGEGAVLNMVGFSGGHNWYNILAVSAGASNGAGGNLIRITHETTSTPAVTQAFLDGDQVLIYNLISTNTTAAGGAAHGNGVWIINKISATQADLQGSVFVADTYSNLGTGGTAYIRPGPQYHMRDILHPSGDIPSRAQIPPLPTREVVTTVRQNASLLWSDSGQTFDNLNATGEVVLTLPQLDIPTSRRGVTYKFVVLTAQTLKIIPYNFGNPGSPPDTPNISSRIFRAGGYASAGTEISSNVVGNSLELYLADGDNQDPRNIDYAITPPSAPHGHRWLVRAETGTWTISGTPPYD